MTNQIVDAYMDDGVTRIKIVQTSARDGGGYSLCFCCCCCETSWRLIRFFLGVEVN